MGDTDVKLSEIEVKTIDVVKTVELSEKIRTFQKQAREALIERVLGGNSEPMEEYKQDETDTIRETVRDIKQ